MTFDPDAWRTLVAFLSFLIGIATGYVLFHDKEKK